MSVVARCERRYGTSNRKRCSPRTLTEELSCASSPRARPTLDSTKRSVRPLATALSRTSPAFRSKELLEIFRDVDEVRNRAVVGDAEDRRPPSPLSERPSPGRYGIFGVSSRQCGISSS